MKQIEKHTPELNTLTKTIIMNKTKRIDDILEEYVKALEFGVADLNNATEGAPKDYYAAIERHHKLTAAVKDGVDASLQISYEISPQVEDLD
jgi:hypothetical protein